ncbi:MAG: hypothetical protein P4L85_13260 [Paludisphaera borealis]|uniref:hypothetical protein n=1 Tax=Paludisphaera borealis TaxID=1387353 RepID=UPI00284983E2|nr:hypothetical protein [Paludisphaera borealis]MDR3620313.1 hypothetical protein [Paludisphaera borealis]
MGDPTLHPPSPGRIQRSAKAKFFVSLLLNFFPVAFMIEKPRTFDGNRRTTSFPPVRDSIIMKRLLLLIAVLLVSLSFARPASAQYGMPNVGGDSSMDEDIQAQRSRQMSQQQVYTKPHARPAIPGANAPTYKRGAADAFGRVDLSGRAAPRYPTIRDGSYNFSPSRYSRGRQAGAKRPQAPRLFPSVGTPRRSQ